jgi:hypothetical protein
MGYVYHNLQKKSDLKSFLEMFGDKKHSQKKQYNLATSKVSL